MSASVFVVGRPIRGQQLQITAERDPETLVLLAEIQGWSQSLFLTYGVEY